jgi:DNA polymerase-3 subunit delta'
MAEPGAPPHPREVFAYDHGEAVEAAFLDALAHGRLHHAWLLTGPEGVGKATFAYRVARRLLGATHDARFGPLGSAPDHPVSRQVAARSHPDLMVLERIGDDGKARKVIPVDDARRLPEFFSKAPASAPWRVAIIDAVDDMNPNCANALLKTLEEPPECGVLLLVSHAPGGLLATIRSRCRRLRFAEWDEADVADFVQRTAGLDAESAMLLARMAKGAPGKALDLAARGAIEVDRLARDLLTRLPAIDAAELQKLAEGFRGGEGAGRFELLFDRLADRVHAMATASVGEGAPIAEGWADAWPRAWQRLVALPREAEALNLDRADAFWAMVADLRAAARA